jgi:hypothetical protein
MILLCSNVEDLDPNYDTLNRLGALFLRICVSILTGRRMGERHDAAMKRDELRARLQTSLAGRGEAN